MSNGVNTHSGDVRNGPRAPFLAFTADSASAATYKQFAVAHNWPETLVHPGDVNAAIEFLRSNASPHVLCIDIASAEAAPAALDALADVCDPDVKVIVSGKINEYSFYCWLMDMGISSYLLKPFTQQAIEGAYNKTSDAASATSASVSTKKNAKIIAVVGMRGGVGATTVAVNTAWILSNQLHQKTALLDFDPQLGTVALALDLEPGKGLRDALEKPERIDGLFLDRVMVKIDEHFSILSTEESLEEHIAPNESAAEALYTNSRPKFSHIVVDVPRTLSPFTRYALKHADHVVCVTEYTISGLRESLRYLDYCKDVLKISPPIFLANRVGMSGKHQMPQAEFEKGLGAKIAFNIPFIMDAYAASTAGEVLAETSKKAPAAKALYTLAGHFAPEAVIKAPQSKLKELLSLLKGGK